jgi:hypothetical protein
MFWKKKLTNLFTYSNKQWLLDQFKYCKWFLHNNSCELDPDQVTSLKFPSSQLNASRAQENSAISNLYESEDEDENFSEEKESENISEDEESKEQMLNGGSPKRNYPNTLQPKINAPKMKSKKEEKMEKAPETDSKIKAINILALIANMTHSEIVIRSSIKEEFSEKGAVHDFTIKKLEEENQAMLLRFASSSFSKNLIACETEK